MYYIMYVQKCMYKLVFSYNVIHVCVCEYMYLYLPSPYMCMHTQLNRAESMYYALRVNIIIFFLLQKSESLQREKEVAHEELERLQLSIKEEQLVKEQLMVQVSELRGDRETSDHLKNELSVAKTE